MNSQEYIISQLENLKIPFEVGIKPKDSTEMADSILKFLFSKKFRKFSIPLKSQNIIRSAVMKNISDGEPIKIVFPFGGFKLWRFKESPEPDWAELFSLIYFSNWLKPVCALYPKGVVFTFWSDEIIISKMNNIPESDLVMYSKKFNSLLTFIQPYLLPNMKFDTFFERSRYPDYQTFEKELSVEVQRLRSKREQNPKPLSEQTVRSIEMNVRLTPEQSRNIFWREEVDLIHWGYYFLQEHNKRVRNTYLRENITAFTVFFEPNVIPIGSVKTSIVRFWVGVGVLQKKEDSFIENILSISQLEKAKIRWETISIKELEGKNFHKIRILA